MRKQIILLMLLSTSGASMKASHVVEGEFDRSAVEPTRNEGPDEQEKEKAEAEKQNEADKNGEGEKDAASNGDSSSGSDLTTSDPTSNRSSSSGGLSMEGEADSSTTTSTGSEKASSKDSSDPKQASSEPQIGDSDFVSKKTDLAQDKQDSHQATIESINDEISRLKEEISQKPWHEKVKNWFLKLFNALPADSAELQVEAKKADVKSTIKEAEIQQKQLDFLKQAQEELTPEQLADKDVQTVIEEYLKLPSGARPESIKVALEKMESGEKVREAIKKGNFSEVPGVKDIFEDASIAEADKTTLTKLLTNEEVTTEELEALRKSDHYDRIKQTYLRTIVDLQWDIYKQAMLDNSGFASGMVTIPDASENVMNLMENYVKLVNPDYNASGTSVASLTNNEGYNRSGKVSSHWKGMVEGNRIYGIDVRFDGEYVKDLPGNKQQLHFGRLTNGDTFIKWEYHGTTLNTGDASLLEHALDYKKTQAMKKEGVNDKTKAFRKEHVLEGTKTAFKEAMGDEYEKLSKAEKKQIKAQGISSMVEMVFKRAMGDAYESITKEEVTQIQNEGVTAMESILQARAEAAQGTSAEASTQEMLSTFNKFVEGLTGDSEESLGYTKASLTTRKGNEVQLPPGLFTAEPVATATTAAAA